MAASQHSGQTLSLCTLIGNCGFCGAVAPLHSHAPHQVVEFVKFTFKPNFSSCPVNGASCVRPPRFAVFTCLSRLFNPPRSLSRALRLFKLASTLYQRPLVSFNSPPFLCLPMHAPADASETLLSCPMQRHGCEGDGMPRLCVPTTVTPPLCPHVFHWPLGTPGPGLVSCPNV
jgi:hypothetical protein